MLQQADVVLDPVAAYPELGMLRDGLARRDWMGCRRVLDAAPPQDRGLLLDALDTGGDGAEEFLREVVRNDPWDGAAVALLADRLIRVGWGIRTTSAAKDVTPEQWAGFRTWLIKAEELMIEGVARNPRDPAIWVPRLLSARGLSLGHAEAQRRYARLVAIEPHYLPAQRHMLQQLLPKWGGSWKDTHDFVREAMQAAPSGSLQGGLVVSAHLEQAFSLPRAERAEYLGSVRQELYEAANRSIGDPGFRRTYGWVGVVTSFACVFRQIEDRAAAAWAFTMLGNLSGEYPWQYFYKDATQAIREARVWALGGAA